MHFSLSRLVGLSALVSSVFAAGWKFQDGTVSISAKGSGVGSGVKETLSATTEITNALDFGPADTLKILLTAVEGSSAKRPHQAFLVLRDPATKLEESFPLSVKDNGKAKLELTHKDIPFQFLTSSAPVPASLILASFGSSTPYQSSLFSLHITSDPSSPVTVPEAPLRYGKLPEIHHTFRSDPRSPPVLISSFFTLLVVGSVPVLLASWAILGANLGHFGKAMNKAPVSHMLFLGSVVAMEGVFFLYYTSWNLFQTLPAAGVLGVVAIVSGSRALTEVQDRRLAGER